MYSYVRYVDQWLKRYNLGFQASEIFSFIIHPLKQYVQRTSEKPCLNDVTGVGTWRKAAVIAAIFVVVLTLLPVWDELAEELGIGLVTTYG